MNNREKTSSVKSFMDCLEGNGSIAEMFDILPDIYFFIKDWNYKLVLCNEATLALFNLSSKDEIFGKSEYDFFPKKMADPIHEDDVSVIEHKQKIIDRTELITDENCQLIWVSTNKLPLHDQLGNVRGLMGTTRILRKTEMLPKSFQQFAEVISFINNNYQATIDVKELAKMSCLSDSQFRKRFRELFKLPPQQFILKVRIQAACKLLSLSDKSLSEISYLSGFCDQSYFTRQFRSFMDLSPRDYRKKWMRV